jgi:hypothetical protein
MSIEQVNYIPEKIDANTYTGTIYKLYSNDPNFKNYIYIGSTKCGLNHRLTTHKQMIKLGKKSKLYNFFSDKIDGMVIEELEKIHDCKSKYDLHLKEKSYIEKYENDANYIILNTYNFKLLIGGVKNVDNARLYYNKYYRDKNHLTMTSKKHCLSCNKSVSYCNYIRHQSSKKHIDNLNKIKIL